MKTLLTRRVLPVLAIICLMATMISGMVFSASATTVSFGPDDWTVLAETYTSNKDSMAANSNGWMKNNELYGWNGTAWNVKGCAVILECNTELDLTQSFDTYIEFMTQNQANANNRYEGGARLGDIYVRFVTDQKDGSNYKATLGWHVYYTIGDGEEQDAGLVFGRSSLQYSSHPAGSIWFWRLPLRFTYDGTNLTIKVGKTYNDGNGVNGKNADTNEDYVVYNAAYTPSVTHAKFVARSNYDDEGTFIKNTYFGNELGYGSVTGTEYSGGGDEPQEPEEPTEDTNIVAVENVFQGIYEADSDLSGTTGSVAWNESRAQFGINRSSAGSATVTATSKGKYSFGREAAISFGNYVSANTGVNSIAIGKFKVEVSSSKKGSLTFGESTANGYTQMITLYYDDTAVVGFSAYATEDYTATSGMKVYALNMQKSTQLSGADNFATDTDGSVYIKENWENQARMSLAQLNAYNSNIVIATPLTVTVSADGTVNVKAAWNTITKGNGAGFDVTVDDYKTYIASRDFSLNDVNVVASSTASYANANLRNVNINAKYGDSDMTWINNNYSTSLNAAKDIYRAVVASEDAETKAALLAELSEDALAAVDPVIIVPFKTTATAGGSIVSDPADLTAVRLGDTVTLTATADEGYEFTGWATSSNKIINTEAAIEVVATTYNEYKAIFTPVATEGTAVITLVNKSGQTMTATLDYTEGDTMTVYDLVDTAFAGTSYTDFVKYTGYKLSGYRVNDNSKVYRENSTETIEIAGNITLTAAYTTEDESLAKYTVTVGAGAVEEGVYQYAYNAQVTVTCEDANFSYWTANDVIVCYNSTYTFNVSGDVTVAPVTGVAATAQPVLYVFQAEQDTNYDSYVVAIGFERSVPENFEYEYVASGIIFYRGAAALDTLTLETEGAVVAQAKNGEANGKYIAKIQLKDARPVLSYIAFVTYRDAYGIEYTVYTNNTNDANATNVVGTITKA